MELAMAFWLWLWRNSIQLMKWIAGGYGAVMGGYGAVMGRLGWMLPLFNVEISGCFQSSWKEKWNEQVGG